MKPTIVLVGRPNVGKSTLFNRLTRTRDAIVADMPGLTRDRHYGQGRVGAKPFIAVDTGGLEPDTRDGIFSVMAQQVALAIDEADAIVFVVDGRQGLTPQDRVIAERLRSTGRRIWLAVNKSEGMDRNAATGEFHELGLGDPLAISAAHGEGVTDFMELVLEQFPAEPPEPEEARHPRIAVVGRPNVGKSTLVNRLLGEERVIAFDTPGTTRDAIEIGFERAGRPYTLIDTAGVRKRGRVEEAVEKFSVVKTLQAIADANVVVLVLDARQGIAEQDAHVAGFVLEAGRALVVAVNKWDGLDEYERAQSKQAVGHILAFLDFARVHYISARAGTGVNSLMASVDAAYASAMAKLSTPRLTRALMAATARQAPPRSGLVRPKLRYAHQGGVNPPRVIIHGNALDRLPETYKRYLERYFRRTFKLEGTPLKIELRSSRNPFAGKRS